jgi:hypothetical protein
MTILHQIGDSLRNLLLAVPLAWARGLFVGSLLALFLWVMTLPRSETSPPRGATRWDENLKLWAGIALVIQIAIYSLL